MNNYNFHGLFSLSSNISYFEGLLHWFRSDEVGKIKLRFILDNKLRISTRGKPSANLMLHYNAEDNSIEFRYPWIVPIIGKLVFDDNALEYSFSFNKNYLRFSNIVAEGWELIDIFRSILQLSLVRSGMCALHGAAISFGEETFLIPSFGNTGKTTTSWMLARRGGQFLTDEFAILDSGGNCFGFPCSSLVSSDLVKRVGLHLTKRQSLSLHARGVKSKILSTRFAPGGIKLYPQDVFQICDMARITRISFIQNGIDDLRQIGPDEALNLLTAIQDYEMNWRSNPYVIALSFFRPDFNPRDVSEKEEKILSSLVSRVRGSYLVSSSNRSHFALIEKLVQRPVEAEPARPRPKAGWDSRQYDLLSRVKGIILAQPVFPRIIFPIFNSYRKRWNLSSLTESTARKTILAGVSTPQEFEERGVQDSAILKRFLTPNSIVLDLGCGIGRVERYLASSCKALYGVDVSDRMLAIARKRLGGIPNVVLRRNNGRDLSDFSNGMFDFVFALLVMHHLDKTDAKTYLKEIHRVLKTGGTLYVQFPNQFSKEFREKHLRHRKYDVSRVRWYTEPESRANLEEAGFKVMSTALDGPQIIQICAKSVELPNASERPAPMITV